ncbi:MAG: DUF3108 domain-containing protein [Bacteroidales bacterium]|nr:DUF3108 domain-containing protein [Bacteroidales bacterium]
MRVSYLYLKEIEVRILFVSILVLINYSLASSQCFNNNFAFQEGEIIRYQAYYNWGFIWLNAGFVEFKVKPATYLDKQVYHFDSYGASHKSYDWIFKVRDRYQAFLDKETLRPLWFHRENYEGGFEVNNEYFFDYKKNLVYSSTENSDRPFARDTIQIQPCTFDVLSFVYRCRNLDFTKLQIGDTIPATSLLDNEIFTLYIRYLGKENIKTREGIPYRCIKFSALLIEGTIFKGGEDMIVWITDDDNRIPVLVEAKILIGSVKAYLESVEGLKNPLTSRIE